MTLRLSPTGNGQNPPRHNPPVVGQNPPPTWLMLTCELRALRTVVKICAFQRIRATYLHIFLHLIPTILRQCPHTSNAPFLRPHYCEICVFASAETYVTQSITNTRASGTVACCQVWTRLVYSSPCCQAT